MSVYYENGQLSRIVFKDRPQQPIASRLVDVGTRFVFTKYQGTVSSVAVAFA